jgi:small subunit ribosomal protein S8
MNVTDSIGDMLTRIRNANQALKPDVLVPYSRLKAEIAKVLKREGYIADFYAEKLESGRQVLKVQLKIVGKERAIVGIKRVSRPGLRRYVGSQDVPRVLGGMGISILTTSRGIMTGYEAKKANVGGELLAYVW